MLYSDALIETPTQNGELLTETHIAEMMARCLTAPPEKAQKNLMREFLDMLGIFEGQQCADDLTLALFTREA